VLAGGGFTGNPALIEARQGFAETLHGGADRERALERLDRHRGRFLVRDTLFKYHAACYLTHSAIDATRRLRESGLTPEAIESVGVEVPSGSLDVCNIHEPTTGLEGKFSLRAAVALGLLGADTADLSTWTDDRVRSPALIAMRDRVTVSVAGGTPPTATPVVVRTRDGRELRAVCDVGEPAADLARQGERLAAKFDALASPVVGRERAAELRRLIAEVETLPTLDAVVGGAKKNGRANPAVLAVR
jgi:2-methylcitrate dehydratase PrpD